MSDKVDETDVGTGSPKANDQNPAESSQGEAPLTDASGPTEEPVISEVPEAPPGDLSANSSNTLQTPTEETTEQAEDAQKLQPPPLEGQFDSNGTGQDGVEQSDTAGEEHQALLAELLNQQSQLGEALSALDHKMSFIPRQLRALGTKIEGLGSTVGEPRCRALLMDLIRVYDLVVQLDQEETTTGDGPIGQESRRRYEILRKQVRQILTVNGLIEIEADGVFAPELHRAVLRVPCDDADNNQQIKVVRRSGFRTDHSVLRYAEVEVWAYVDETADGDGAADGATAPKEEKQDGIE